MPPRRSEVADPETVQAANRTGRHRTPNQDHDRMFQLQRQIDQIQLQLALVLQHTTRRQPSRSKSRSASMQQPQQQQNQEAQESLFRRLFELLKSLLAFPFHAVVALGYFLFSLVGHLTWALVLFVAIIVCQGASGFALSVNSHLALLITHAAIVVYLLPKSATCAIVCGLPLLGHEAMFEAVKTTIPEVTKTPFEHFIVCQLIALLVAWCICTAFRLFTKVPSFTADIMFAVLSGLNFSVVFGAFMVSDLVLSALGYHNKNVTLTLNETM